VRRRTNYRGQLRIDERRIDRFGGLRNPISGIGIRNASSTSNKAD
jgi:hypothetical protein